MEIEITWTDLMGNMLWGEENLYNNQELHVLILIFFGHSLYPSIVNSITDMVFVNHVFYRERGELYDKNEERS